MSLDATMLEIARALVLGDDGAGVLEELFKRVLRAAGAHAGYVVVREGEGFVQKYELNFGGAGASDRKFSRSLVRQALQARELIHSANLHADQRVVGQRSVVGLAPASVV